MNLNYSNDSWTNGSETSDEVVYTESFDGAQIVLVVLYTAVSLTSLTGNGAVCYVVFSTRRMRTVTNYFISSLAISDLLMATLCIPFTFVANVLLDHWPFGSALCPVVTYLQAVVVFQNAYTFLAISLERYIAIMYPFKPRLPKRKAFWVILLCWFLSFVTPLPTAITSTLVPADGFGSNSTTFLCVELWPSSQKKFAYSMTIMVLQRAGFTYFRGRSGVLGVHLLQVVHATTAGWCCCKFKLSEHVSIQSVVACPESQQSYLFQATEKVVNHLVLSWVCWLPLSRFSSLRS
ncbi:RYamide receptor-like [Gigantopelta aegis]|uniref:RYamide receptor-like n=1 Tax=Gigantopelta aegis TaxID=1735272 RepID=UPI001B88A3D3|nr:RYamide receptor-like [Gigantopelta aegis]